MPGIHHVTGITGRVQANVDFYTGLLGLRLVKQTVSHNDGDVLHLFYGDGAGSPGSLLTFFAWPDGAGGRRGHGQAVEVGLAVPLDAIGYWTARLIEHGVKFSGPTVAGSATHLGFSDPDGLPVVLIGSKGGSAGIPWSGSPVPAAAQVRGIASVTLWTEHVTATGAVLELLGYERASSAGATTTYRLPPAVEGWGEVLVRDVHGFWSSADGAGSIQHVAFGVPDVTALGRAYDAVLERGLEISNVREHGYFQSIYFREPGGGLIELATEGPGMTLDESLDELGTRLALPPDLEATRADVEVVMPHFAPPGAARRPERDLGWTHRYVPGTSGATLLVLHGSGGSETQLLPLARRVGGGANLLAPRGRSTGEEALRFFARRPDGSFDQAELDYEADALARFVTESADWYDFDPQRVVILGYSNGAHIGAAALARNPTTFAAAALLRTVAPFALPAAVDLAGKRVLMLQGVGDHLLRDHADTLLADYLTAAGAGLQVTTVPGGHYLGPEDEVVLRAWLDGAS